MKKNDVFVKPEDNLKFFESGLNAIDSVSFIKQFKEMCHCKTATSERSIVYVWYTTKTIPRLKGCSDIVYIGKTQNSFKERHLRYAQIEGTDNNWKRYQYIMKKFGPINIVCCSVQDPRKSEKEMLLRYLNEHLELPPIHASF